MFEFLVVQEHLNISLSHYVQLIACISGLFEVLYTSDSGQRS